MDKNIIESLYEKMFLIRYFEETLLKIFSEGLVNGTTHTYIGQEANAVGIIKHLDKNTDYIVSNHRCHGHYLAQTDDVRGLLFEIMGLSKGICSGKGGSQHLYTDNFLSNGILGGMVPIAVGLALSKKIKAERGIVLSFLGDGMLGEGIVYEALNIASLWQVPILFVVENNLYAQSTPIRFQLAGSINERFEAFGIESFEISSTDVSEIFEFSEEIIKTVRQKQIPKAIIFNTYRFAAHSKGDDFRDKKEIESYKKQDPLIIMKEKFPLIEYNNIEREVKTRIQGILTEARYEIKKDEMCKSFK